MKKQSFKAAVVSLLLLSTMTCMAQAYQLTTGRIIVKDEFIITKAIPENTQHTYSADDFAKKDGKASKFDYIVILELPSPASGTLSYNGNEVAVYQRVTARTIDRLKFTPALNYIGNATLVYRAEGDMTENGVINLVYSKQTDTPPAAQSMTIATFEDVPRYDRLAAGSSLSIKILKQPRIGTLTLTENCGFIYSPNEHKTGKDNFKYLAIDKFGNSSKACTVTVQIKKAESTGDFTDTKETFAQYPVKALAAKGLISSDAYDEQSYFDAQGEISRGEFTRIASAALNGIPEGSAEDPEEAAINTGLVYGDGQGSLRLEDGMTRAEAAVAVCNALALQSESLKSPFTDSIPEFAAQSIASLYGAGIFFGYSDLTFRGNKKISKAEAAALLARAMEFAAKTIKKDEANELMSMYRR